MKATCNVSTTMRHLASGQTLALSLFTLCAPGAERMERRLIVTRIGEPLGDLDALEIEYGGERSVYPPKTSLIQFAGEDLEEVGVKIVHPSKVSRKRTRNEEGLKS